MIRTQIQLGEAEYKTLKDMAHKRQRSMADCIREAIGIYLQTPDKATTDFEAVAGRFRPIATEDLKDHDRLLTESILGRD